MPILRSIGDRLLTQDEAYALEASGRLAALADPQDPLQSIDFAGSPLRAETLIAARDAAPTPAASTPVEIGRPLTIEMDRVYTGHYPSVMRLGPPDCLVTTAVRPTYKPTVPKALNLLLKGIDRRKTYSVQASGQGTRLIYHTPSLTDHELLIDVDIAIDRVDEEAFDQVANTLSTAAQIPIFISASAYLMGGAVVVKLLGNVAKILYESGSWMGRSETLQFDREGALSSYGPILLCRNEDVPALKNLRVNPAGELIDPATGNAYVGPSAYVSAYLNGRPRPEYKDFAPTVAAMDLLDRFYRIKGRDKAATDVILDALRLYNDFDATERIASLNAEMATLDAASGDYKRLEKLRDAWIKKIQLDVFKP